MGIRGFGIMMINYWLIVLVLLISGVISTNRVVVEDLTSGFELSSEERSSFGDGGQEIKLSLTEEDGSGFASNSNYLFGMFNMRIKLVGGNSAGTVTAYYFSSNPDTGDHDELDFEFLGNVSGQPVILQTNVYANGIGEREQRVYLWFDPSLDYHNYSILWNQYQIVFFVDEYPIRVYPNIESTTGVPFLRSRPMNVFGTIWNGDSWATEGGRVKIDWTNAPFIVSYRDFYVDACSNIYDKSHCISTKWWNQDPYKMLTEDQLSNLNWVKTTKMVYDYCNDKSRFSVTPTECYYTVSTAIPPPSPIASSPSPTQNIASSPASYNSPSSSPTQSELFNPRVNSSSLTLAPSPSEVQQSSSSTSKICCLPFHLIISFIFLYVYFCMS